MVLMNTHFKFRFEAPYERPLLPMEMDWNTYLDFLNGTPIPVKEVIYQRVRGDLSVRELRALPDPLRHQILGTELVLTYKLSKSQVAALAKTTHPLCIGCPFIISPMLISILHS